MSFRRCPVRSRDHAALANEIGIFLRVVHEASRAEINKILHGNYSSGDITAALRVLYHTRRANVRKVRGGPSPRPRELWRSLELHMPRSQPEPTDRPAKPNVWR